MAAAGVAGEVFSCAEPPGGEGQTLLVPIQLASLPFNSTHLLLPATVVVLITSKCHLDRRPPAAYYGVWNALRCADGGAFRGGPRWLSTAVCPIGVAKRRGPAGPGV